MKPESFEKKLYIARNVEGEPSDRELLVLRELEKRFAKNESFVGLSPFGSVVSGYSTEESDLDVYALCNWPKGTVPEIWREPDDVKQEIEREYGMKINLITENINLELLIHDLELGIKRNNPGESIGMVLAEMSRLVTGKKIDQYRRVISDKLQKLPANQRQQFSDTIIESLTRRDAMSLGKRSERVKEFSKEEHQGILEERKKMWQERVKKIWKL